MQRSRLLPLILLALGAASLHAANPKQEQPLAPGGIYRANDPSRPRPPVITPPGFSTQEKAGAAPSDAIVLFDGKDLSKWQREPRKDSPPGDDKPTWKVENGYMEIVGNGQGRGNSGVFIEGFPEIQVLDSYQNDTYPDGQAAGLYKNYPPMVNASRKPGEWQTYDILFERSTPTSKAKLTVIHNGIVVQYQREFDSNVQEGDLLLQDHLNPVRYRNIWLRPLRVDSDKVGTQAPPKAAASKPTAAKPEVIRIKTMTAQMKYDETEFTVRPGQPVKLIFENGDDLPHNLVLCQPGTDTAAMAMKQMEKPEEALKRNWLPDDPRILQHTKMLNPHEKEELTFTAPEKPGDYPFVCTFPGHALTMNGKMKVLPLGEGLKELKFALYLGDWTQLPDFATLKPHREGVVEDNLVQIKLDDYKNHFGVVFTGKLTAPRKGSYRFYIAGDDGVRLLINGKQVIIHDGIHPAGDIKEGSTQLEQGDHEFRLEYFQAAGDIAVFAAWKGANFDITPLSAWTPDGWQKGAKAKAKKEFDPIPLVVKDEPVIYRNFIEGAGNRGIAVGYPGGINIAWSAEAMNLAVVWRGAFIDAAMHWNSRGGGKAKPLGYDTFKPAGEASPALFITDKPDSAWPVWDMVKRFEGFHWKGYSLDQSRNPTFRYTWNGAEVEESFTASGNGNLPDGNATLTRTVKISGTVPANAWYRLATGANLVSKDGSFLGKDGTIAYRVTAPGAQLAGQNLVIPANAGTLSITYQWAQ